MGGTRRREGRGAHLRDRSRSPIRVEPGRRAGPGPSPKACAPSRLRARANVSRPDLRQRRTTDRCAVRACACAVRAFGACVLCERARSADSKTHLYPGGRAEAAPPRSPSATARARPEPSHAAGAGTGAGTGAGERSAAGTGRSVRRRSPPSPFPGRSPSSAQPPKRARRARAARCRHHF